jgi:hypothetical protein
MTRLFNKYKIEKKDGSPVDHDAQYFVLRLDTDVAARRAMLEYSRWTDTELKYDILIWLLSINPEMIDDLMYHEKETLGLVERST